MRLDADSDNNVSDNRPIPICFVNMLRFWVLVIRDRNVSRLWSEWFFDRSTYLLKGLDQKDHPYSEVIIMLPPNVEAHDDYNNMTIVPTRSQHREAPDVMDMCEADVKTEWF